MNYSLKQIINALSNLYVNDGDKDGVIEKIAQAQELLQTALADMDGISVQGRSVIDTLLGCMMYLEQITGKDGEVDGRQANF